MKKHLFMPWVILLAAWIGFGCASGRYGRLDTVDRADPVTVEMLVQQWESYDVYYTGLHAGHPSAVLFERKDDDMGFLTGRWSTVKSKDLLDDLVDSIRKQLPFAGYYPRLWKLFGPDGHLYGYMFTSWDHAVMKVVDEKTMFVNDIPLPPYLAIDGDGRSFRTP